MEMIGTRPMTAAERQRRSRAMRALRAEDEARAAAEADLAELDFHDDAALGEFLKNGLAELQRTRMTDEELNALLDEVVADQAAREDRIVRAVNELRTSIDRLRGELRAWQPTHEPGLRHAVEHGFAGVKLDLGVAFHQFTRLLRGEGLTVVDEAFGPVDPALRQPAPIKRRF